MAVKVIIYSSGLTRPVPADAPSQPPSAEKRSARGYSGGERRLGSNVPPNHYHAHPNCGHMACLMQGCSACGTRPCRGVVRGGGVLASTGRGERGVRAVGGVSPASSAEAASVTDAADRNTAGWKVGHASDQRADTGCGRATLGQALGWV